MKRNHEKINNQLNNQVEIGEITKKFQAEPKKWVVYKKMGNTITQEQHNNNTIRSTQPHNSNTKTTTTQQQHNSNTTRTQQQHKNNITTIKQ